MDTIVKFNQLGGPEVLYLEQVAAAEPKSGEVRIRVEAFGLNRAEALFRSGQYLEQPEFPSKIGIEAAGIVESVGPGVTQVRVGDRVAVAPGQSMAQYGTHGDAAIVPASVLVKYPENISPIEAAASFMQYLTAYFAFVELANVQPGQTILITAASSSTGVAAIELAHLLGARAIATTRTQAKRQAILNAGADEVIVTAEENLPERVKEMTGGKGADLIYDPIAGGTLPLLAESVAWGGQIILYGFLDDAPTEFPLFSAFFRNFLLRTYMIYNFTGHAGLGLARNETAYRKGVAFVVKALAEEALKPVIAATFPLKEIVQANQYLESNQQLGKIVVTVHK
ncbi:MAG: putative quinone oxidoreductase [Capsulimonas sp.]|nr:putative quinone oxidoreductase [Capsulimonas sp.]